jgi:hypothetical protein
VRQAQFAAFDPEPDEEAGEPAAGEGDEGEDDDDEDSLEDFPVDELSDVALLEAVSLALAALRLSVR